MGNLILPEIENKQFFIKKIAVWWIVLWLAGTWWRVDHQQAIHQIFGESNTSYPTTLQLSENITEESKSSMPHFDLSARLRCGFAEVELI